MNLITAIVIEAIAFFEGPRLRFNAVLLTQPALCSRLICTQIQCYQNPLTLLFIFKNLKAK